MREKEALNSEEAAHLLGFKPGTIRALARRGTIPAIQKGDAWQFSRSELIAWLREQKDQGEKLEQNLTGAAAFLQRTKEDDQFRQRLEACKTDEERMNFVKEEGFFFTLNELEESIKAELAEAEAGLQKPRITRKAQRYQVYLAVSELNGENVTDTVILDISAWGAKLGSLIPVKSHGAIEITFTPPGESHQVRLTGEVVWTKPVPTKEKFHSGIEFFEPIDQLHRKGEI